MDHRFNTLFTHLSSILKRNLLIVSVLAMIAAMFSFSTESLADSADTTTTSVEQVIETTSTTSTTTTLVPTTTATTKTVAVQFTPAQVRYLTIMHVNSIQYIHGKAAPAMEAYRLVAAQRGWTPKEIKSWEIAIANIMMGESGFCPNLLRGAIIKNPVGCILARQGRYSDSGFGQLISIHYRYTRPGTGWLCKQERLCSKWEIIASPWNSMTALLALIERSGVSGWCYNSWARSYHRIACSNPGLDV